MNVSNESLIISSAMIIFVHVFINKATFYSLYCVVF